MFTHIEEGAQPLVIVIGVVSSGKSRKHTQGEGGDSSVGCNAKTIGSLPAGDEKIIGVMTLMLM